MAQIISILGNKGGTGKTTMSHMLGHGFGLLGLRAVVAVTDTTRDPLSKQGRRYLPADARTPEQLAKIARTLQSVDGWIGIIDGGAGRQDFDDRLAALSQVVLLPFRESHEDIRTVKKDLARLPQAFAVPSQWPTNAWALEAANRTVQTLMSEFRDRILPPVFAIGASKLLLQVELPTALPSALNVACRGLARHVALLAGIEVPDDQPPIARQDASSTMVPRPGSLAPAAC